MLYCLHCPTLNKVFLLFFLLLLYIIVIDRIIFFCTIISLIIPQLWFVSNSSKPTEPITR